MCLDQRKRDLPAVPDDYKADWSYIEVIYAYLFALDFYNTLDLSIQQRALQVKYRRTTSAEPAVNRSRSL